MKWLICVLLLVSPVCAEETITRKAKWVPSDATLRAREIARRRYVAKHGHRYGDRLVEVEYDDRQNPIPSIEGLSKRRVEVGIQEPYCSGSRRAILYTQYLQRSHRNRVSHVPSRTAYFRSVANFLRR